MSRRSVILWLLPLLALTDVANMWANAGIMMDPVPGAVETGPGPVEPAPGPVEPAPGPVEPAPGPVEPAPGPVESAPGPVEPAPGLVEPAPGPVGPAPGPVETAPGPVESAPGPVEPAPGPVEPAPGPVGPAPGPVETATGPVEPAPGPVEPAPGPVEPAPGPVEPAPGPVEPAPGPVGPASGPVEPAAGPADPATGPADPATGPVEPVEPAPGPAEPSTGSGAASTATGSVAEDVIPPEPRPIVRPMPEQAGGAKKTPLVAIPPKARAPSVSKGKPFLIQDLINDSNVSAFEECRKANCKAPSLCYIPHPNNCFKFIMCQPTEAGALLAQVMPCAFGTKWKSGVEPACDRYDLVKCPQDPCRDPRVDVYGHPDGNCRTFWRCVDGQSHPGCCDKYQRYDPVTGNCVNDETCDDVCPLMNDATCRGGGLRYTDFPDGNCRTHWDCEIGNPHPVCCPDGQGFNVFTSTCDPSIPCNDACPQEYQDSCSTLGVSSYDLVDGNCRTYMKCNKQGQADPSCCLAGMEYDAVEKKCVDAQSSPTCWQDSCPYGFIEECRLEAIPGKPGFYKNLDYYGGHPMPCPIGTVFNASLCQCRRDYEGRLLKKIPPGCNMDIHVIPPSLQNNGTALAALLMIGEYGQGETGVGNMNAFWDGGDGLNIPYYGSQTFNKFNLEIAFQPTQTSDVRQILLSSCAYVNGQPTLEVSLDNFAGNGGNVNVRVNNADLTSNFVTSAPYQLNDKLVLRLVYDGTKLGTFLDYNDPARPAHVAAQPFTGQVAIDRAGLRFAHCRYEDGVVSFIGYVNDIKFGKCVPKGAQTELNNAVSGPVP